MRINQIKEQVKLRQEHLKKCGYEVKLADLYECVSWENGFRNWNTFKASLEESIPQHRVDDFFKVLFKLKEYVFDDSLRDLFEKETFITKDMLAGLIRSLHVLLEPILKEKAKQEKASDNHHGTDSFVPLIVNNWKETHVIPEGDVFFKDMKNFYNRLKRIKSREGVCWSCGVTSDNEDYPFEILFFPVKQDLKSLSHRTQGVDDRLYLCVECAVHYMTEFNLFCSLDRDAAIFQAAQFVFEHMGYLAECLPKELAGKVLSEAQAKLTKK